MIEKHVWKSDTVVIISLFHRCFFKHFASKNQLTGLSVSGTLVENGLKAIFANTVHFLIYEYKIFPTTVQSMPIRKYLFEVYKKGNKAITVDVAQTVFTFDFGQVYATSVPESTPQVVRKQTTSQ